MLLHTGKALCLLIKINGKTNIRVTLKEDTEMLDEVVVVGYGTMKKRDMTGAISSVDVDDLVKRTTNNPAEALQGKSAGVNIMKAGGNAGADVYKRQTYLFILLFMNKLHFFASGQFSTVCIVRVKP